MPTATAALFTPLPTVVAAFFATSATLVTAFLAMSATLFATFLTPFFKSLKPHFSVSASDSISVVIFSIFVAFSLKLDDSELITFFSILSDIRNDWTNSNKVTFVITNII